LADRAKLGIPESYPEIKFELENKATSLKTLLKEQSAQVLEFNNSQMKIPKSSRNQTTNLPQTLSN